MKIKLFSGEYLFSEEGNHVCDNRGIAIKADHEIEVEISESRVEHVVSILSADRQNRGLNANGEPILEPSPTESLEIPAETIASDQQSPEEEIISIPVEE